jgi:phosphopantetheinyl transferase
MSCEGANVWIARPHEVGEEQMRSLELTLDSSEMERASKFRYESDRRAYVVVHGLRRIALGDLLGVNPAHLVLAKQSSGQPLLIWPRESEVFFSHSHTRKLVAFAVSSAGPVGIDVECVVQANPDFDLLAPYVVLPGVSQRVAELGINPARQFFFYWTALEAFWKAAGKGLSPGNPRIRCEKNDAGTFEITLEGGVVDRHCPPHARVSTIHASKDCVISLAQMFRTDAVGGRMPLRSPDSENQVKKQVFLAN